jgi:pyrimidine-nucleoside phosphorylase
LIASSIMSKKIASGAQAIVLDVKVGVGAFMQTVDEARQLARLMVSIGELAGREVVALLSGMNQPLGQAVGNTLEVREAIETLRGDGPQDFRQHCLTLAAHMLMLGKIAKDEEGGCKLCEAVIEEGRAFEKFRLLVEAQGGDVSYVDHPEKLPKAKLIETVRAPRGGYLQQANARLIGEAAVALGAGRERKGDVIDHAVGVIIHHKVGDKIEEGEALFTVHANDQGLLDDALRSLLEAHTWSDRSVEALPLFYEVVR